MTDSAYARAGARLVDMGYSALPILPNAKRPGSYSKGKWWGMDDWQRFSTRMPSSIETDIWSKWPNAGVGVALGSASGGLAAVDIDCDQEEIVKAIKSALPEESPVQKMGKRGFTAFYRARPCVFSTSYNLNGDRAVDLLCEGRQTLVSPTIHPDTGRPYMWLTMSTLEDTSVDRLPLLPDDIADRIGDALKPWGYFAPVERQEPTDGDSPWSEVKEVAIANYDAWLPALGIFPKRGRHAAVWRGGDNPTSAQIDEKGIYDHREGRGYSPHDVVMGMHACDFPTADKWLREKLGFKDPPPVVFTFRKPAAESTRAVAVEVPLGTPEPKLNPFDHKIAGGLLEQTAAWVLDTSFVPSRELSLLAAIGIMCAFMGRRYVGPSGLAPNLYLVGLASTGSGKDAPLKAVKNLFLRGGGMDHMLGAGDLTSDAAIERIVRFKPSCISPMDEIGAWLQEGSGRNSPQYAKNRRKTLLELYANSQVGGIYLGKDKAGSETMSSSEPIFSPCFSLFGMSTPELFFKGLTDENTVDGFLNRLTVVHIPPCSVRNKRVPDKAGVPRALSDAYDTAFSAWQCPPGRVKAYRAALADPFLYPVPYANQAAEDRWNAVWDWQEDTIRESETSTDPKKLTAGLIKRTAEQTIKLAMIRAVSRDFATPAITVDDVEFGAAIVYAGVNMLNDGMRRYMSGSEFEDNCKTLLRAVEGCERGLTETELTRRAGVSKIDSRRLKEAIDWLSKTGRWEAKKQKRGYRYLSLGEREALEGVDDE